MAATKSIIKEIATIKAKSKRISSFIVQAPLQGSYGSDPYPPAQHKSRLVDPSTDLLLDRSTVRDHRHKRKDPQALSWVANDCLSR